ncbi:aldo/keto reductase [Streptomyces sp. NPDC057616]|uniref:aldo/keto reductase n=1 Tax=Streptomyces sp. NPDC057616 TaxID=3346183 RepID=UPI00367F5DD9
MTAPQSPADPTTTRPGGTALLAGRTVARIGFGVMQLHYATDGRDAAHALLREAIDLGVNHLDTAHFYGPCNELVREALTPYPDDLVLVSKVGADDVGGRLVAAQRPEQLRAQVEENLSVLGVEQLDVVNVRRADAPPGLIAEGDQKVDLDSQLAELSALRDAGKIGGIGLSNVSADQLRQALPAGIVCVQNDYGVLERTAEPVLGLCREHAIAWVPFCPLGSRFPNRPKATGHPEVIAVADELGCTPAQVALAWLLARYDRTLLIAGTADPGHLRENVAAGGILLPPEAIARLDRI